MRRKGYAFLALDALQSLSVEPGAAPSGESEAWVQILPYGTPPMNDDRKLKVDSADLLKVLSNVTARQSSIPILYEHGWGPHGGEAAGWLIRFEIRVNGLFGLVRWTASAAAEIREKKWLYLSPGFMGYADEDGFIRPRTLFEASLTNTPAIDGMAPVEATAAWLAISIPDEPKETPEMDLKKLALSLKLKENATEAEVDARVSELLAIEATPPKQTESEPETVTLSNADLKTRVEQMAKDMTAKNAKEKAASDLLAFGIDKGKILPPKKDAYATVIAAFPTEMKAILEDVGEKVPGARLFSGNPKDVDLGTGEEDAPGFMDKVVRLSKQTGLTIDAARKTLLRK